jgi:hypothetical protein
LVPIFLGLLARVNYHVVEVVEVIQIGDHGREMGPELHLVVADTLYLLRHLTEETFKFLHIGELFILIFVFFTFCLDIELDHVLVAVDRELLVEVRTFLTCNLELVKSRMDVAHHHEVVIGEEDVDGD